MDNPIVQRLKKLTELWLDFTDNQESRICRWLPKSDELSMIRTFYQLQTSEGNDTGDFFIQLSTRFKSLATYSSDLKSEFLKIVKSIQEETDETDIKQWTLANVPETGSPDITFLAILKDFAELMNLPEGFLVIFLTPSEIKDLNFFKDWLANIIEINIPEKIKFMLIDSKEEQTLADLCVKYPQITSSFSPNLNMNAAVNELASVGDPSKPDVQFRKAFVLLIQAIGKQDMWLVKKTSDKAFKIAEDNNWLQLKVVVKMATAGAFLGKKDYNKAYEIYGEAFNYSEEAYKGGDPSGSKLAVTTLFSQASAMIVAKKYDIALESYMQAIPYAEETDDFYNQMEAWRMSGFCNAQLKKYEEAWDNYKKALDSGENMDEELRKNSTLPFVGNELKIMAQRTDKKEQLDWIEDKMVQLVGKDWTEKLDVK